MLVSYKTIGNNIKKARKAAGLTRAQLAEELDYSNMHMGRLERGERPVSLEMLAKLTVVLRVPLNDLLRGCVDGETFSDAPAPSAAELVARIARIADGCDMETCRLIIAVCRALVRTKKR